MVLGALDDDTAVRNSAGGTVAYRAEFCHDIDSNKPILSWAASDIKRGACVMPILAQLYEYHAEDCIRSAANTDDPKHRDMLLKLASEWRKDAEALRRGEELHLANAWPKKH